MKRLSLVLCAVALMLAVAVPANAVAPAGKHYAGSLVLFQPETGGIEAAPVCLSFTKNEACTETNECGPWEFIEKTGRQNQWTLELALENDVGSQILIELTGRTERRGPKSSIGATFFATVDGVTVNGAFAGTQTSLSRCLEFGLSDD